MNCVLEQMPMTHNPALSELLLGYLQTIDVHYCPGVDGMTVEAILSSYLQAALAGHVPGHEELRREHPELADELAAFFVSTPSSPLNVPDCESPTTPSGIRAD